MKLSRSFTSAALSGVAAWLLVTGVAQAEVVSFAAGSYRMAGIGAQIDTDFDVLQVSGLSSFIDVSGGARAGIAGLAFTVGPNCTSCDLTPSFDARFDFSVDGVTQQIDLPYSWWSAGASDNLAFGTPATLQFDLASGNTLQVAFDTPGLLSSAGGTVSTELWASFSMTQGVNATGAVSAVPEPQTYALLLAGLGAIGFIRRRRK